jgi:hypothetical protein
MTRPSVAILNLLRLNEMRLPSNWKSHEGHFTQASRQETFWACVSELIAAGIKSQPLPEQIVVGKENILLQIEQKHWTSLRSEIGWDRENARNLFLKIVRSYFELIPRQYYGEGLGIAHQLTPRLIAIFLLIVLLKSLEYSRLLRSFAYEFTEISRVAQKELQWLNMGSFHEFRLMAHLFEYSGAQIRNTDRLLYIPFHAFWRPFAKKLSLSVGEREGLKAEDSRPVPIPSGLLVQGIEPRPSSIQNETPWGQSLSSEAEYSLGQRDRVLQELNHLRKENDALRSGSAAPLIIQLLAPLLTISGEPSEVLNRTANNSEGLAREILLATRASILSGDVEFIGEPGQVLSLSLPHDEYCIEGPTAKNRNQFVHGLFRVGRRGIRIGGYVIAPALITRTAVSY